MNELFSFLLDEDILKNKVREKWITILDFNYIDNTIIPGLMETKNKMCDLFKFINDKATIGYSQKSNEENNISENELSKNISKTKTPIKQKKQITIPEPFNLSVNKPRILQPPIAISNIPKFSPLPLANYQKTSLKTIEEDRKNRLNIIKKNILERTENDNRLLTINTEKYSPKFDKIKEEIENEKKSKLQFNNKYSIPLKDFSKCDADVKYNEAAILKEEYLLDKKNKEEEAALNKILIEKKDSSEFDRWNMEMKIKDEMGRLEEIEKRKIQNELIREFVSNYYQYRVNKNQSLVAEHKKQELLNKEIKNMEKKKELINKKKVIKEIQQSQENAQLLKIKNQKKNQIEYKNRKNEINELNLMANEEKKIYLEKRDDIIRQIRILEKLPIKRKNGYDPTETPGYGFLEEMSLVELKERLALQKKMLIDEMNTKKEENKLKMKERADNLLQKAQIISENREKLRNQKEIERKNKMMTIENEKQKYRLEHEKKILEFKKKFEKNREKLKKEDELFQKKIFEIKLQRQFNKLSKDAVEYKQFELVEDGMEKKVLNKQNQALEDQLAIEHIKWDANKLRYNQAKQNKRYFNELLSNYNNDYQNSVRLDKMVKIEDKSYNKAVYDRERSLEKYRREDINEKSRSPPKNRLCKSVINRKEINNIKKNNKNEIKSNEGEINENIKEGIEEKENENEEDNDIQNKLKMENSMSLKEATLA